MLVTLVKQQSISGFFTPAQSLRIFDDMQYLGIPCNYMYLIVRKKILGKIVRVHES